MSRRRSRGKRVAVVLSGCGYLDGSEIHETTLAFLALDFEAAKVQCYAPNKPQMHVMNHIAQEAVPDEARNVLEESARLARGNVKSLDELNVQDFDALLFPGGFGAAKNLSDYALKGAEFELDPLVDAAIKAFHQAKKPICAMCIAPVLIARSLGAEHHPKLTVGDHSEETAKHIEQMGAEHEKTSSIGVVVDDDNLIVSTPAYMAACSVSDVWVGVMYAVREMIDMA